MPSSPLQIRNDLPFVEIELSYRGHCLRLTDILVDCGSGSSCIEADLVRTIGLIPEPNEVLHVVRGVGAIETVFTRLVDSVTIGSLRLSAREIDVGAMNYGFGINGIIGMDILLSAGAIIDFQSRQIRFAGD